MPSARGAIESISRVFPLDPPQLLLSALGARLEGAMIFVTPASFARFALALLLLPTPFEVWAALVLPPEVFLPATGVTLVLQLSPVILLVHRAGQRRRLTEGELPFVGILLFVLSHGSFASLPAAFRKVEQLGPGVFPAFFAEAQNLGRNLAYGSGSEHAIVERTFEAHPSRRVRDLVHGYLTTLFTGRDVHEFLRAESERLLAVQEEGWRSFAGVLSTMTEVSFIFLAVFPVGIQMIAGTFAGQGESLLLLGSLGMLCVVAVVLLTWMDMVQPVNHDAPYAPLPLLASLASLSLALSLYYAGMLDPLEAAVLSFLVSSFYVAHARGFSAAVRSGEADAASVLHDLSERVRAGAELPSAISAILEEPTGSSSIRRDLATFSRLLSFGESPVAAQKKVAHPSWVVRVSFALLALCFETGGGYDQLEKLSLSFRRMADSRRAIRTSVLPFALLGASVPVISASSFWFLRSLQSLGNASLFPSQAAGLGAAGSILATSIMAGVIVSKAYTMSLRSLLGLPLLLFSVVVSFLVFGGI